MQLKTEIIQAVHARRIQVTEASRWMVNWWNERRDPSVEPRFFCGWYWWREDEPDELQGPFRSMSAAYRDAYVRLQLHRQRIH